MEVQTDSERVRLVAQGRPGAARARRSTCRSRARSLPTGTSPRTPSATTPTRRGSGRPRRRRRRRARRPRARPPPRARRAARRRDRRPAGQGRQRPLRPGLLALHPLLQVRRGVRRGRPEHVRDRGRRPRLRRPDLHRVRRPAPRVRVRLLRQLHRRVPDRRADVPLRARAPRGRRPGRAEAQTVTDTICPYCGVGCTLSLHVQDNRIVKVTSPMEISRDERPPVREGPVRVRVRPGAAQGHAPARVTRRPRDGAIARRSRSRRARRSTARPRGRRPAARRMPRRAVRRWRVFERHLLVVAASAPLADDLGSQRRHRRRGSGSSRIAVIVVALVRVGRRVVVARRRPRPDIETAGTASRVLSLEPRGGLEDAGPDVAGILDPPAARSRRRRRAPGAHARRRGCARGERPRSTRGTLPDPRAAGRRPRAGHPVSSIPLVKGAYGAFPHAPHRRPPAARRTHASSCSTSTRCRPRYRDDRGRSRRASTRGIATRSSSRSAAAVERAADHDRVDPGRRPQQRRRSSPGSASSPTGSWMPTRRRASGTGLHVAAGMARAARRGPAPDRPRADRDRRSRPSTVDEDCGARRRPLPADACCCEVHDLRLDRGRADRDPVAVGVDVEPVAAQEARRGSRRAARPPRPRGPIGALTAARIGTPATAAFWTSSKLARPETSTIRSWSGRAPASSLRSRRACPARCAARRPRAARAACRRRVEQARRVEPARVPRRPAWASRSAIGRASSIAGVDDRARRDRRAADLDLVQASPCRRSRTRPWRRSAAPRRALASKGRARWTVISSSGRLSSPRRRRS